MTARKLIKTIILLTAGVFVLLALMLAAVVSTFDINQYKDQIIQVVEGKTGRNLEIGGDIHLGYSLIPTLVLEDVSFGNPEWASSRHLARVKYLEVEMALMPLLKKHISVNRIVLESPEVFLETDKDGKDSWIIKLKKDKVAKQTETGKPDKGKAAAHPATFNISKVRIRDARLSYKSASSKSTNKVRIERLEAEADDIGDPVDILLIGELDNIPLAFKGQIGSLAGFIANEESMIDINGRFSDTKFALSGKVDRPLQMEGLMAKVRADLASMSALEYFVKKPLPAIGPVHVSATLHEKKGTLYIEDLEGNLADITLAARGKITSPEKLKGVSLQLEMKAGSLADLGKLLGLNDLPAAGPVRASALVSEKKGGARLANLDLKLGKSDLSGDLIVILNGERPALYATLSSGLIEISPFMPPKNRIKIKKPKVFSNDTLPFDLLNRVDARLDIKARRLETEKNALENVAVKFTLETGRLSTETLKAVLAEGSVSGNLTVDATKPQKTWVNTSVNIYQLIPGKLPDLKGEVTGAPTDIFLRAKGSGRSIAELMANMDGHLQVKVGRGNIRTEKFGILDSEILSTALNTLLPLPSNGSGRELICAVFKFDITDGIAVTDKGIALSTKRMDVVGSGIVNLKNETMDIGIKPRAKKGLGISAGELADLVRLAGPISDPEIRADTVAAFKKGFSVGAAVATGGISLLAQGLYSWATVDDDPCRTALESGKEKQQTAGNTSGAGKTSASGKEPSNNRTTLDKFRNFFKQSDKKTLAPSQKQQESYDRIRSMFN